MSLRGKDKKAPPEMAGLKERVSGYFIIE